MIRRIASLKYLVAIFLFVTLFFIQSLTLTWTPLFAFQALILNVAIMLGIYAFRGFDNSTTYSLNSCVVSYISGTILGILFALLPIVFMKPRLPRPTFYVTALIAAFIFPLLSCMFMRYSIKHLPPKRYLVIGREEDLGPILEEVKKASMGKIEIYSYMNPSAATLTEAISFEDTKPFDAILIGDPELAKSVRPILNEAITKNTNIEYLPTLVENSLHRIPIEIIERFSEYYEIVFSDTYLSKRMKVLDLILTSFIFLICSPFLLFTVLYVLIRDGRPVFFSQERAGYLGKPFALLKLRTMDDVTNEIGEVETVDTKSGKLLRKFRLNEIPQILNVLRGQMSLVGCRPDLPWQHQQWSTKFKMYSARMNALPGISGHAQVFYKYVRTDEEVKKRLEYDLYYIKNRSVKLYLITLMRTFETVLLGRGK